VGQQRSARNSMATDSKFKLEGLVDTFYFSCFVHIRKPDADNVRLSAGYLPGASPSGRVNQNTPMFRSRIPSRRIGDSKHLHTDYANYARETGFVRIDDDNGVIP